jgi:hypothetical protein
VGFFTVEKVNVKISTPVSTLRFSQLILDLSPHLAINTEPEALFQNNRLGWRSDIAEISSEKFSNWRDRVGQWIRDVET